MFEAGLHKLLDDNSSAIGGVFYPGEVPQGSATPVGSYFEVTPRPDPTFDTAGPQQPRFQFDCYGKTALEAMTIRDGLVGFLPSQRNVFLNDGSYFQGAQLCDRSGARFDQDRRQWYCIVEFYLFYNFAG